jgi:hypothetical protein
VRKPENPVEKTWSGVKISSSVLGSDIWLSLRDAFDSGDGLSVFYASEIPILKRKSAALLRVIHEVKLTFGPGTKVQT